MTLTCTARAVLSPKFRFIMVNGSSSVIVQDGSSSNFTTLPLDYKEYNNYKATYQCIAYNRVGESPAQTLVLDIQGNSYVQLIQVHYTFIKVALSAHLTAQYTVYQLEKIS